MPGFLTSGRDASVRGGHGSSGAWRITPCAPLGKADRKRMARVPLCPDHLNRLPSGHLRPVRDIREVIFTGTVR